MSQVSESREQLKKGNIVVFPTETAYGIAADATNPNAVEKVYEAKQRPRSKGLTVICSSLEQAKRYSEMTELEVKIAREFMPGPLTMVVEKKEKVPENLNEKFAFRVSSSQIARELASDFPITATSANVSGRQTCYDSSNLDEEIVEAADHVVDEGELDPSETSTIVEIVDEEIVVHREGPVSLSELREFIHR